MTDTVTVRLPADPVARPVDLSRPHFVGIGGAGMSVLAQIALARGAQVSGSDITGSGRLSTLTSSGCRIQFGHGAANVGESSCVVFSTAIAQDNAELVTARERGIPVVHRAHALAALMEGRTSVAVAGTHGKSSTTAMLAVALRELGLDPSYAIGADLHAPGSGGHHGTGEIFVAEADESDHSFHVLRPDVALVLNVDDDHPENYGGLADHINAYAAFARGITMGGVLVVNIDDDGARQLSARLTDDAPWLRLITYGAAEHTDVRIISMQTCGMATTTTVAMPDGTLVRIELGVPAHGAQRGRCPGHRRRARRLEKRDRQKVVDVTAGVQSKRVSGSGRRRLVRLDHRARISRTEQDEQREPVSMAAVADTSSRTRDHRARPAEDVRLGLTATD